MRYLIIAGVLVLTACHKSTTMDSPSSINPELVAQYLEARAKLIRESSQMSARIADLGKQLDNDCKKKGFAGATLDNQGQPFCLIKAPTK